MKKMIAVVFAGAFILAACEGGDSDGFETADLSTAGTLVNCSGYTVKLIYATETPDYRNETPVAQDLVDGATWQYSVPAGSSLYITFVRTVTSTSTSEIAVTTSKPVTFGSLYKFNTLDLLENDFYFENIAP